MQPVDIIRHRKHNQSSLQIAANSIISETSSNRPSIIGNSGTGLPPKGVDYNRVRVGNNEGNM